MKKLFTFMLVVLCVATHLQAEELLPLVGNWRFSTTGTASSDGQVYSGDVTFAGQWGDMGGAAWGSEVGSGGKHTITIKISDPLPEGFQWKVNYIDTSDDNAQYVPFDAGQTEFSFVFDQTYRLLSQAYAAVVCSGTATLETALFHVPQVVCYRAGAVSIAIARALVGRRINHIALVDLIDDSNVVTELLQQDYNDRRLEEEFRLITLDTANRQRMLDGYRRVEEKLGSAGASLHTAQAIIQEIEN